MFVLKLASDNAVLYGNIVPSTKKQYSIFFVKMVFVFQKISFNVKEHLTLLKTFKISSDCHTKSCIGKRRAILKIIVPLIRRTHGLSVSFKTKPLRKRILLC